MSSGVSNRGNLGTTPTQIKKVQPPKGQTAIKTPPSRASVRSNPGVQSNKPTATADGVGRSVIANAKIATTTNRAPVKGTSRLFEMQLSAVEKEAQLIERKGLPPQRTSRIVQQSSSRIQQAANKVDVKASTTIKSPKTLDTKPTKPSDVKTLRVSPAQTNRQAQVQPKPGSTSGAQVITKGLSGNGLGASRASHDTSEQRRNRASGAFDVMPRPPLVKKEIKTPELNSDLKKSLESVLNPSKETALTSQQAESYKREEKAIELLSQTQQKTDEKAPIIKSTDLENNTMEIAIRETLPNTLQTSETRTELLASAPTINREKRARMRVDSQTVAEIFGLPQQAKQSDTATSQNTLLKQQSEDSKVPSSSKNLDNLIPLTKKSSSFTFNFFSKKGVEKERPSSGERPHSDEFEPSHASEKTQTTPTTPKRSKNFFASLGRSNAVATKKVLISGPALKEEFNIEEKHTDIEGALSGCVAHLKEIMTVTKEIKDYKPKGNENDHLTSVSNIEKQLRELKKNCYHEYFSLLCNENGKKNVFNVMALHMKDFAIQRREFLSVIRTLKNVLSDEDNFIYDSKNAKIVEKNPIIVGLLTFLNAFNNYKNPSFEVMLENLPTSFYKDEDATDKTFVALKTYFNQLEALIHTTLKALKEANYTTLKIVKKSSKEEVVVPFKYLNKPNNEESSRMAHDLLFQVAREISLCLPTLKELEGCAKTMEGLAPPLPIKNNHTGFQTLHQSVVKMNETCNELLKTQL